jgi:Rps23 Pro-64 3,4-dihydroxylase Tpa1-like proline 4-hydroxylase
MTVVNLGAIRAGQLEDRPYPHAVLDNSFEDLETTVALSDEFPSSGFRYDVRESNEDGKKRYRAHNYQLVSFGRPAEENIARLTGRWRQVLDDLMSDAYRDAIEEVVEADLSATVLDVRLVRYARDCWIEPHVDRPDKVVTQLFYFNLEWQEGWAGALRILRGSDMDDYERQVFPHAGNSVVMVRNDDAWHGVPPVCSDKGQDRKTLLVHFAMPAEEA